MKKTIGTIPYRYGWRERREIAPVVEGVADVLTRWVRRTEPVGSEILPRPPGRGAYDEVRRLAAEIQ